MIADLVADYAAATEVLLDAAALVTPENIDRHQPGGWSARQVLHHVADSEAQSYARLRRLLAEPPGSIIQGYDEAAWARAEVLGYQTLPVEHALAVYASVRQASLDILRRLTDADLAHYGEHTESGHYTVATWLETYIAHPREHATQLREAISA